MTDIAVLIRQLGDLDPTNEPQTTSQIGRDGAKALTDQYDRAEELEEILHDITQMDCEERAIGGGPGWKERKAKIWARAHEWFEP